MRQILGSDDDDDLDRPSRFLQTQRFSKTDTFGTKDFKIPSSRPKHNEGSNMKLNLHKINDEDEEDSLNDSDDDTNTKTARSTSSGTTSQLTPKPKERSFIKKDTEKPKITPRRIDIDDNDRDVFGHTTMKPSPRQRISTLREDEENNQLFMHGFSNEKRRQSPTDIFSTDQKSDARRNSRKFGNDHDDSDDESLSNKQLKHNDFQKSRHSPTIHDRPHSPTINDRPQSRKNSTKSKEGNDYDDDHFNRQDIRKQRLSNHDLAQTSPKDTDWNASQHQLPSSRPSSASKKEVEPPRRSSFCEDQDAVIPPTTHQQSQSRPTSAKSNTTRQQTQSAIDNITSANIPPTLDPLTSNNEALAAALQPSLPPPPPPRPSAKLPPRPKPTSNTTTSGGGINKKPQFKVPSRYKEITSRVDTGRASTSTMDLTRSIERALDKEIKSQTLPRPQSARSRKQSANNNNTQDRQRRRSSSGYEHIKPRVNTNLSINFDELNTSQMRADSSQSIKDGVYHEWLKTKEEQRKRDKEEAKQWQDEKTKHIDRSTIERKVHQNAQNLERWRLEKEEQTRKKKQEELNLKREQQEKIKQEQQKKKKEAKDGFEDWKIKKEEDLLEKKEEERNKKTEIEQRQEEKQKKILEAEKAYEKWMNKKTKLTKKQQETQKTIREEQLKKIRENEETKFVTAQEAYENWIKDKEKYEIDEKLNTQRRDSLSTKQQPVPFLPGGSQKNTGKVRHVVW